MLGSFLLQHKLDVFDWQVFIHITPRMPVQFMLSRNKIITHYSEDSDKSKTKDLKNLQSGIFKQIITISWWILVDDSETSKSKLFPTEKQQIKISSNLHIDRLSTNIGLHKHMHTHLQTTLISVFSRNNKRTSQ